MQHASQSLCAQVQLSPRSEVLLQSRQFESPGQKALKKYIVNLAKIKNVFKCIFLIKKIYTSDTL